MSARVAHPVRVKSVLSGAGCLVLDAVAPRRCAACDSVSAEPICADCSGQLLRMPVPPPRRLQRGLAYAGWEFIDPVRHVIHRGKFGGDHHSLRALARLAWPRIATWRGLVASPAQTGAVVPVPLGSRRRRQRGYNQAEVIAGCIAEIIEAPLLAQLVRTRNTPAQSAHDENGRRRNVDGAFAWRGPSLDGAQLLLVDDVLTTGATVSAVTAALVAAGARRVDVTVLAAVP
jgi:ComF family protein